MSAGDRTATVGNTSDGPALTADTTARPAAAPAAPVLAPGDCLGRYTVRARIGGGGMGEVFRAHDPELDRDVALKVIRPDRAGDSLSSRARFQREAQAMARLNHPNVVSVHDVGTVGDRVFVAMELVDGPSVADWLAAGPRSWREVVDVFLQAGRGLEAAHSAGIVHRDFKPSNVIMGDRVRVADFGLARAAGDAPDPDTPPPTAAATPLDAVVTRTGFAIGTPAYMSPEQAAGGTVGPLGDQFSFAVSLHEALTGGIPGGPPPRGPPRAIPGWLGAVVERALQRRPEDRYPSMRALLADLARDPARARRRALAAAGVVALAGVAVWGLRRADRPALDPCAAPSDRFAGVWHTDAVRAVHAAFLATKQSYAETSFRETARQLDRRRGEWEAMRRTSCEATRVRGVQSDAMMDLRAVCLDGRADDVAAFVGELRKADVTAVRRAAQQAVSIGDVTACADAAALARRAPLPAAPARRDAIDAIEADLARARARAALGQHPALLETSDALVARARAADYAPLLSETLALAADVQQQTDHVDRAEALLEEAVLAAEAGGDDRLRLEREVDLVFVVGYLAQRDRDGSRHAQRAAALLARLGADPRLSARLATYQATMDWAFGRYTEAHRRAQEAIGQLEELDPEGVDLAKALHLRGIIEDDQQNDAAALATEQRARAIAEHALGPDHPLLGTIWNTTGGALRRLHRYDEARQALRRALAINEATHGPESRWAADALGNLATVDLDERKYDDAIALLRRAVAIYEQTEGPEGSDVGLFTERLGETLSEAGHAEEAEATLQRAVRINRKRLGADSPAAADSTRELGEHHMHVGKPGLARAEFAEAVRALETSQGPTSPLLLGPLRDLGDAELALHRRAAAIAAYERALGLIGGETNDREAERARIQAALDRARATR